MKKSEVLDFILSIYEEASSCYKAIGSQKVQLMSSSIFGLGFLVTFSTFFYYLARDNILGDIRIIYFAIILVIITILIFFGIAWYFLFLHKLQRIHWVTTACLEKLIKDFIKGKKDEEKVIDETIRFLPQIRIRDRYDARNKRWFKNSIETDEEQILIDD